jgi:hypothetical protein
MPQLMSADDFLGHLRQIAVDSYAGLAVLDKEKPLASILGLTHSFKKQDDPHRLHYLEGIVVCKIPFQILNTAANKF